MENNYEQLYKEALERAKKFEDKYGGDYAGYIFPELAESEDERIRKAIIGIIKNSNAIDINVSHERMIAYLEKQKDIEDRWIEDRGQCFWDGVEEGKMLAEKQKEQKEIPLMNGDADLYFDNWIQHNDATKRGCFEEGIRYAQRLQKEQIPPYVTGIKGEPDPAGVWKPSEEQMNALYDILHPADTVNRPALESLYEQLKKL